MMAFMNENGEKKCLQLTRNTHVAEDSRVV